MDILRNTFRYLGLWFRPPKISRMNIEEIDDSTISFISPIFVLSTGRCGTKWLSELLRHNRHLRVNHNDYPELIRHSRMAYERYNESPQIFQEIIRATRDGYILDAYKRNQIYIETNNRITFFAYAIRAVYPNARFIFLVRHPGEFVRSGLRRGWYKGSSHDVGRIRNINEPSKWETMTDIEKIAWLWNETNRYIEGFLKKVDNTNVFRVKAEEMFVSSLVIDAIIQFIGAKPDAQWIKKMISRKINRQVIGRISPYNEWSDVEKADLRRHALLSKHYGYDI